MPRQIKSKESRVNTVSNKGPYRAWPFESDPTDPIASPAARGIGQQALMRRRRGSIEGDIGGDIGGDIRGNISGSLRAASSLLRATPFDVSRPTVTLGWHPDIPDARDQTVFSDVRPAATKKDPAAADRKSPKQLWTEARTKFAASKYGGHVKAVKGGRPDRHENLRWCSPIEDQGPLGSCTAQAVVSLIEFMQRRHGGDYVDGSRLFLYKVSRNLLGWNGDSGAYIRTALKAAVTFGVPPERFWPYDCSRYDEEPTPFLYSYAQEYQALDYARLDDTNKKPEVVLETIKKTIAGGLGVVFGFTVYSSLSNAPDIPFPTRQDTAQGGHAIMVVGYDDTHRLPDGTLCPSLIIRNSWGPDWGIGGYGFLPDEYVLKGLVCDVWTILKAEWLKVEKDTE